MEKTLELLKTLAGIPAPSGNEMALGKYVYQYMKTFAPEVEVDRLGNVMACVTGRKSGATRILLTGPSGRGVLHGSEDRPGRFHSDSAQRRQFRKKICWDSMCC